MGLCQNVTFCSATDPKKMKRQPQKKIFTNHIQQELVPRIHEEHSELNSKTTNNPVRKWAKDMERHFPEEGVQMADKHMKPCSASLAIREMQIKPSKRCRCTPTGMAKLKNSDTTKCRRGCRETGSLLHD